MGTRKYLLLLADGREVEAEAPDTTSPEEVRADAELNYPGIKDFRVLGRSGLDEAKSLAADAGRGFVRGGAMMKDLLTLPGQASDYMMGRAKAAETGAEPPPGDWFPQTSATGKALDELLPTPRGDSTARQYLRAGVEGAGGALAGGGGGTPTQLAANLGVGAASSLAAKGAEDAGGGTLGAAGASTAVALLGAMATRKLNPNEAELARRMFSNVKPANLENAVRRMREMQARGTPINLSQALRGASNVDDMVEYLARTPMGDNTSDLLRSQLSRTRLEADILASDLPGRKMVDPQDSANLIQQGSTDRLKQVKDAANAAYREKASLARPVAVPEIEAFRERIAAFKAAHPNVDDAQKLADDVLDALTLAEPEQVAKPVGKGLISGRITPPVTPSSPTYLTDPNQLKTAVDSALKGQGKRLGVSASSDQRRRQMFAVELNRAWKETIRDPNPGLADAAAAARQIYVDVENPLRKGVVGRMAGRGASDTAEAPKGRLTSLMRDGSPSDLRQLTDELPTGAVTAMRDAVASDVANALKKHLPAGSDRISNALPAQILKSLGGTSPDRNRLMAKLSILEDTSGIPPGQLQDGFEKFLDYLGAASTRPAKVSGLPSAEIGEVAGKSVTADVLQAQAPWKIGLFVRRKVQDNAYEAVDKLINTPEGVETLKRLAKETPRSPGISAALAALFGEAGSRPSVLTESDN